MEVSETLPLLYVCYLMEPKILYCGYLLSTIPTNWKILIQNASHDADSFGMNMFVTTLK